MDWKDTLLDIVKDSGNPQKRPKQKPQAKTLRFGEPLSKHTYFGIGGEATAYIEVSTVTELAALARFHRQWDIPVAIIGRGSNLLVSDTGFNGIGVRLVGELAKLQVDGKVVSVGAGLSLPRLSKTMSRQGLSGVEFALGIPGSVGGALIMNAGAWGSSFGDVVTDVTVMNDTGELVNLTHAEAAFEYRHSGLDAYFCVTGATLKLEPGDADTITARMQAFYKQKVETQPFAEENAGCMFKNPPGDSRGTTDRHQWSERSSHRRRRGVHGTREFYSQYRQRNSGGCAGFGCVYPRAGA